MNATLYRFLAKARPGANPDDCWLWSGAKNENGYGVVGINKRSFLAHRVSFELFREDLAPDVLVMHTCDVSGCVNPVHLIAGTVAENLADKALKKRCGSTGSKLTREKAEEIRAARRAGLKVSAVSARFGVSGVTVRSIVAGRTWR